MNDRPYRPLQIVHRSSPARRRTGKPDVLMVARKVKLLMESKGWIPSDLARQADLDRRVISTLMTGTSMPTHANLMKIAKALRVKPEQLDPHVAAFFANTNKGRKSYFRKDIPGRPGYAYIYLERVVTESSAGHKRRNYSPFWPGSMPTTFMRERRAGASRPAADRSRRASRRTAGAARRGWRSCRRGRLNQGF